MHPTPRIAVLLAVALGLLPGATCNVKKPEEPGTTPCGIEDACGEGTCVEDPEKEQRVCAFACGAETRCPEGSACVETSDGQPACLAVLGSTPTGEPCQDDRQCVSGACAADEDGDLFCVDTCLEDGNCIDPDRECYFDELRRVCLDPVANPQPLGAACTYPQECESSLCIDLPGDDRGNLCAQPCAEDPECGSGQRCAPTTFGGHVCLAPLEDGAPCITDEMCAGGSCIADTQGSGETLCASACGPDGTCAAGFACVSDEDGAPVCMPLLDDRGAGEACAHERECASGLCVHFDPDGPEGPEDLGTLCADPCAPDGSCPAPQVCWQGEEVSACGPAP